MTTRTAVMGMSAVLAIVLSTTPTEGQVNCDTPTVISSNTTLANNFVKTVQEFEACIFVTGSAVLNMGGHTITCNSATGCGPAINVSGTGRVHNGEIVAGTGAWNVGAQCFNFGSSLWTDCEVSNMLIFANTGVAGGRTVDTTVFRDADVCVDSSKRLTSGGFYRQNFCSASNTGFVVTGPTSGSFTVDRNFVRASTGTGVELDDGNLTMEHNIIDAATPIDDTNGDTVILSENICSDLADCPEPTERGFSLSVDFD